MSADPDLRAPRTSSAPSRTIAWIDATAGIAGDMLLGALVDAGADLSGVQTVVDALIPGSVALSSRRVDRCGQAATKIDVDVLVDDPPHRTWSSIRDLLEQARDSGSIPRRTADLALDAFSRLADAEAHAHGVPADSIHFHEVGALDSIADVVGACEAWRQLGIESGIGSTIAVGSGRIRAAHGDIPVPVPAVARLALGWPTVAGDLLPGRPHSHGDAHGHSHEGDHEHSHGHDHDHDHSHDHGEHPHGASHSHDHDHDHLHGHDHGHPHGHGDDTHEHDHGDHHATGHSPAAHAHSSSDDAPLAEHEQGGPHSHASGRGGVAPGIGELATPTGVALVRALASRAGAQPPMRVDAIGIGAGTKDTAGRPNVVRVLIGVPADVALTSAGATRSPDALSSGIVAGAQSASADAQNTPTTAVQLEANVDDLDPRLWPGVIDSLLGSGALDAWLTPIVMKRGRPAVTVHVLVREGAADEASALVMDLTGTLGVRAHPVRRRIRTRSFDEIVIDGERIAVKLARDEEGTIVRAEPEFRDVTAAARALGTSERRLLDRARAEAAGFLES